MAAKGRMPVAEIRLIEVAETNQPGAVSADVTNLQREVGHEGVLDTQVPIRDVGALEIRVYAQEAARAGSLTPTVAEGRPSPHFARAAGKTLPPLRVAPPMAGSQLS